MAKRSLVVTIGGGFIALCVAFIVVAYAYEAITGKNIEGRSVASSRTGGVANNRDGSGMSGTISALFGSSDSSLAHAIYESAPGSPESNAKIIAFAKGVWTYTAAGEFWERYTFDGNGNATFQSAVPASDNWGESDRFAIEPITDKFFDTGKRYFGFRLKDSAIHFLIEEDGTLAVYDVNKNAFVPLDHRDANPFTK